VAVGDGDGDGDGVGDGLGLGLGLGLCEGEGAADGEVVPPYADLPDPVVALSDSMASASASPVNRV
jgi:hypothetical protein